MRLHHLSVTAFGPFVEPMEVDFDRLSDAGLFLLSGPTGAGKSSVLDAVCFALYGAVPGDRQHAGRLRSDQAPPTAAPSVTLEADLSGRRFRVIRSPAWERPKKRGTGMTREQARVTVSERIADEWVPLTGRLDEAGDLLSGLLGMNLDQFCQVALLPQGHFQVFLRADSGQRHQLLARLFRTGRFERVEAWLREHRLELRRRSDQHVTAVAELVSRLSEAAGTPMPEELADLTASAAVELPAWSDAVFASAADRRETSAAEAREAGSRHDQLAAAATAAREISAARARVVAAASSLEHLEGLGPGHTDDVSVLEGARHAQGVDPLARLTTERARARATAQDRVDAARAAAVRAGLDPVDPDAALERVTGELAALNALLPAERHRDELREQHATHTRERTRLTEEGELASARAATLAALTTELSAAVAVADDRAQALAAVEADVDRLQATVQAHARIAQLDAELESAQGEHQAARTQVLDLRHHLLDLRERRITGMAAELAGRLVVGDGCPVCGSPEHPAPAVPGGAPVDGDAERVAQHEVDSAQVLEHALHERVRELQTARTREAETVADTDVTTVQSSLTVATHERDELRSALAAAEALPARLAQVTAQAASLAEEALSRTVHLTEVDTTLEQLDDRLAALDRSLADARGDHPELRVAVAALTDRRELARALRAHESSAHAARAAYHECLTLLERAAGEAGFATVDEALAARLSEADRALIEQRVQTYVAAMAAARQVLDEPGAPALLRTPEPDVAAAEGAASAAAKTSEHARAGAESAARTARRVEGLRSELVAALTAWSPVREELALATRVATFAEGKAPDNRLQMRLSAYVLAHRLSQVVAAANARLTGMSDRRYSLEHVGQRGAGERRGGLSLAVRDDWSGESRDPATLSGGETFVVSLALALGLADVVAHEAGGADLQTLFVDEGFGALDSETLDDVLDILDTLRENGRAVGVVSHVAEMRDRIPTQLVVGKARTGSTLRVVG